MKKGICKIADLGLCLDIDTNNFNQCSTYYNVGIGYKLIVYNSVGYLLKGI